ncbi:glycoside hydrolase family 26 protein [Streptomyces sp. NPDC053493]|uniref:glycoside hydrolase family 26 protein n=1 Tax=Streptomyces sp. NPDC053493 TaxID=3365705 RepID=UPI0037CD456B
MRRDRRGGLRSGVLAALVVVFTVAQGLPCGAPRGDAKAGSAATARGVFTGSLADGIARMAQFEQWAGQGPLTVGRTFLPGDDWESIEGPPEFLAPWGAWRAARPGRTVVMNVPMLDRSEAHLPDAEVAALLRDGADGRYDGHFRILAQRLVALGLADTELVLGWEMNGITYTHRCHPDPARWRAYWRRVVDTMRAVKGQRFRFDFAPNRGRDAVPWTSCYPGDAYVDVIGMDAYDHPAGTTFRQQADEPYGLRDHVAFAERHHKPFAYPEWGLYRNGDNPAYMRGMLDWFRERRPLHQALTDYCPHGVWSCPGNEAAARVYRAGRAAARARRRTARTALTTGNVVNGGSNTW